MKIVFLLRSTFVVADVVVVAYIGRCLYSARENSIFCVRLGNTPSNIRSALNCYLKFNVPRPFARFYYVLRACGIEPMQVVFFIIPSRTKVIFPIQKSPCRSQFRKKRNKGVKTLTSPTLIDHSTEDVVFNSYKRYSRPFEITVVMERGKKPAVFL